MARHTTAREKRKARIRKKLAGTTARPRLTVYRSLKHIYAQVIDDVTGQTLVCAGSNSKTFRDSSQEAGRVADSPKEGDQIVAASEESNKVVAASEEGEKAVDKEGKKASAKEGKKASAKGGKKTAAKEGKKAAAKEGKKVSTAARVGTAVAKAALEKGIKQVVFDRNGFDYHGRIAAVAEAARKTGLQF